MQEYNVAIIIQISLQEYIDKQNTSSLSKSKLRLPVGNEVDKFSPIGHTFDKSTCAKYPFEENLSTSSPQEIILLINIIPNNY